MIPEVSNDHIYMAAIFYVTLRVGSSIAGIMSCCCFLGCNSYNCKTSDTLSCHYSEKMMDSDNSAVGLHPVGFSSRLKCARRLLIFFCLIVPFPSHCFTLSNSNVSLEVEC